MSANTNYENEGKRSGILMRSDSPFLLSTAFGGIREGKLPRLHWLLGSSSPSLSNGGQHTNRMKRLTEIKVPPPGVELNKSLPFCSLICGMIIAMQVTVSLRGMSTVQNEQYFNKLISLSHTTRVFVYLMSCQSLFLFIVSLVYSSFSNHLFTLISHITNLFLYLISFVYSSFSPLSSFLVIRIYLYIISLYILPSHITRLLFYLISLLYSSF